MSNACGWLVGTIGSGILYTYVGEDVETLAGTNAMVGMAACFLTGTICSLIAVIITWRINNNTAGLKCGSCITLITASEDDKVEKNDKEA